MASSALEEKINKIKLQNEEIRRRYEEVEADKKNAAKLNALVKMVPSDDWPERKEPPEFSAPPKIIQKQKILNKDHNDRLPQHYSGIQERLGKKDHKLAQGDGPPPDPKYNFLADSEREIRNTDNTRVDEGKNRSRNKALRGASKKRGDSGGGSRDAYFKDNRGPHAFYSKEEALPEYEAWRAERNRIDEARINRQKTAEGNWRREWDSNKTNVEKDSSRKGDSNRKDLNNYERRNSHYDSDYINRGHGGSRTYHGSQKNHNQDYRRLHHEQVHEYKRQLDKPILSSSDDRTVTATDKNVKVTLNHGNQVKGPVMSVKVNSPSIAGTGRVGPRQKSRVTYSSQSDADVTIYELSNFSKQKSFDERTAGAYFNSGQKSTLKSPFTQRKKEGNAKSPYTQRKDFRNDELPTRPKTAIKSPYSQRNESRDQKQCNTPKIRVHKRSQKSLINKVEILSISDEAIPSEYNPDKSFNNREDVIKQRVDTENDNFEKALNKTNNIVEEFSNTLKNTNDSEANDKYINQNKYDNSIGNANYQNSDNNKIDHINKNNEHIEINETIKSVKTDIEHVKIDKNIEQRAIHKNIEQKEINKNIEHLENNDSTEKNLDNSIDKTCENIQKDTTKISNSNDLLHITDKNNEKTLPDSDTDIMNQKHNLRIFTEENVIQDVSNHKIKTLSTEKNVDENIDIKTMELEQKSNESKTINNEFQQMNIDLKTDILVEQLLDNITNEIVESQEKNITDLNNSHIKYIRDSDLIDHNTTNESIQFTKNKTIEIVDSQIPSKNDSGFIDDFDKLENNSNASIIKSNDENSTEKNSQNPVISDSMELTKEVYKKEVEICDIPSAAFNKASEVIEGYTEIIDSRIDKQEVSKILENYAKDNEVHVVEDINNLELLEHTDIEKKKQNDSTEQGNFVKEKTNVAFRSAAIVTSDESMKVTIDGTIDGSVKVASDESMKVISDGSMTDTSNVSTKVVFDETIQIASTESTKVAFDELTQVASDKLMEA